MCGGGGSSQPKPPQPVQMVPQPARTQQEIAAAQGGTTEGAFGSELSSGSSDVKGPHSVQARRGAGTVGGAM